MHSVVPFLSDADLAGDTSFAGEYVHSDLNFSKKSSTEQKYKYAGTRLLRNYTIEKQIFRFSSHLNFERSQFSTFLVREREFFAIRQLSFKED